MGRKDQVGTAVGIDLGTTNSAIARVDENGRPVVIPNTEGRPTTPSVVAFQGGEVLVGESAREEQSVGRYPVAAFFKREMGKPYFLFHADGTDRTATDLSAMVLCRLKADAEAYTGERLGHAVITVPAYFRDIERKATIAAGEAAGFEVLQVVNEPTAAAVAYGLKRRDAGKRILVYDLGGGTFDVTLLELTGEEIRVLGSDGDHQLGGKDWDDRIVHFLSSRFHEQFGANPLERTDSIAELLIDVEDVKKRLSSVESAPISIVHDGRRGRYVLDRTKFEELTVDLLERTISLTRNVLDGKGLRPEDVDGVLLVGGATRMPMVRRLIERDFGQPPMGGVNVDEAVALGAAVVAAAEQMERRRLATYSYALPGIARMVDVTNHSLGMIAVNARGTAYVNTVILPKNTEIPCAETRPYQYRAPSGGDDNRIEVFMTQGEVEAPADAVYIGKYVIHDVVDPTAGASVVDISYQYDRSGTVKVTARMKGSRSELPVTVEALPDDVPDRFLEAPHAAFEHMTVYLVFDISGSMDGEPLEKAKKAGNEFLRNVDLSYCSVGLISFHDKVITQLEASQNARLIEAAIAGLRTGGGTSANPFPSLLNLITRLEGRRFAIVLTDGVWANRKAAIRAARTCHRVGIEIIAIGFGNADRHFLDAIASNDEASFFTSMNSLSHTLTGIAQVLTETGGALTPSHYRGIGEMRLP